MSRGRPLLGLFFVLTASAADKWIDYRIGPFHVISNAGDKASREKLNQMEQLRYALGMQLGKIGLGKTGLDTRLSCRRDPVREPARLSGARARQTLHRRRIGNIKRLGSRYPSASRMVASPGPSAHRRKCGTHAGRDRDRALRPLFYHSSHQHARKARCPASRRGASANPFARLGENADARHAARL